MKMNFDRVDWLPANGDLLGLVRRSLDDALDCCLRYLHSCASISKRKPYFKANPSVEFYRVFKRASQLGLLSRADIERINSTYAGTLQELETLVSWLILIEELAREDEAK